MQKIFIYSNSFIARTIICQLEFVLNFRFDEVFLMEENHRQDEMIISEWRGFNIIVLSNIDECVTRSTCIFVIKDSNTPTRSIKYISEKAIELHKKYIEIENPWSSIPPFKKSLERSSISKFKDYPAILTIALGLPSQQYILEIALNKLFEEHGVKTAQFFSPATYCFLKQLNVQGMVHDSIEKQLKGVDEFEVLLYSINIGEDFNNIINFIDVIKDIGPDFVILQTGIRFDHHDIAKQMLKYGCSSSLDMIVKSHYNNITLERAEMYYCDAQIEEGGIVYDIEKDALKEEVEIRLFSKLALPKGVFRI